MIVLGWNQDIDAVGPAADMVVDPAEFGLSWSGAKVAAPSTPKPPALVTSTTTSRQCENAKIGTSQPSLSAI